MADSVDQAAERVADQRRAVADQVEALDRRLRSDLSELPAKTRETVEGTAGNLPGMDELSRAANQWPLLTLGGAVASGVALGMMSGGRGLANSVGRTISDGASSVASAGAAAADAAPQPMLQALVGSVARELLADFKMGASSPEKAKQTESE